MFDRSERRHHVERLKNSRKHYWGYGRNQTTMNDKQLGAVVQHPASCSCPTCGNVRKHFGNAEETRTLAERRQIDRLREFENAEAVNDVEKQGE